MRKLILLLLFLFVSPSLEAYASPQIPDIFIYEGKEYPIQTEFLRDYFKRFPLRDAKDKGLGECSANRRGYQATFEVLKGSIYLKDVIINVCMGMDSPTSQLKKVAPSGERLLVNWVSSLVGSGYGENLEDPYSSLEFMDAYEKYSFFEVDKGRVVEVRHFDNQGYRTFKKNQFEAFRKTPEYEPIVKRTLNAKNDVKLKLNREDAAARIQHRIFSYTKTFLVEDGGQRSRSSGSKSGCKRERQRTSEKTYSTKAPLNSDSQ